MRTLPGLNIQFPISRLIHSGEKSVETRTYPLPQKYVGKDMYVIETPGESGDFSARVIGVIVFGPSFQYKSKEAFYADLDKHRVGKDSPYAWSTKPKWGWPIESYRPLRVSVPAPSPRGIRYTIEISI